MQKLVESSEIKLNITAPASKSILQRALIAALLTNGETRINGVTLCDDAKAAIDILGQLGVKYIIKDSSYIFYSRFNSESVIPSTINCGESGLLARVMIPIIALTERKVTITGKDSLMSRPFDMVERPLRELGAEVTTNNGLLPAKVSWQISGGETTIDGSVSSQFLTGLLMALPLAPRNSTLYVTDLNSRPYIDLTIDVLKTFGISIKRDNYNTFYIAGNQKYRPSTISVEGDWSAASLLLVAGAIAGEVSIDNLNINSRQADRVILDVFRLANVRTRITQGSSLFRVTASKSAIRAFEFDATQSPDLFPALVALAAFADGVSVIKGVKRLVHKESNRAETLKSEFGKLGIRVEIDQMRNCMIIYSGEIIGGEVMSHGDHRVAMAMAICGLKSQSGVKIDGAESVNKSYPSFWSDIAKVR